MTEKKLTNKPEKGNWEKVSWEVKAHHNSLFANAYVLGYMATNFKELDGWFKSSLETVKPLLEDFILWKMQYELTLMEISLKDAVKKGYISQQDVNQALVTQNLNLFIKVFKGIADLWAEKEYGYAEGELVKEHAHYWKLGEGLKEFLSNPNNETFQFLIQWTHYTGSLFTGSTGVNAPITQEFADFLHKNPHVKDVVPYCAGDVKSVWKEYGLNYREGTCSGSRNDKNIPQPGGEKKLPPFRAAKKEVDLTKLWSKPGKKPV